MQPPGIIKISVLKSTAAVCGCGRFPGVGAQPLARAEMAAAVSMAGMTQPDMSLRRTENLPSKRIKFATNRVPKPSFNHLRADSDQAL